jgi:hypothetical protein
MIAQLRVRRDTNANWTANNPVLANGEIGVTTDAPFLVKMGDGTATWNALESFGIPDGGDTNEVLAKASSSNRDLGWIEVAVPADTTVFTSVGVGTAWAKPAGCKAVRFQVQGGGGSGGSGARGLTTALRWGGTGGQAGGYTDLLVDASGLPATMYVTVGAGGTAPASTTSDTTAGANGNAGQASFVATSSSGTFATAVETALVLAHGGSGGLGGLITTSPSAQTLTLGAQVVGGAGALPANGTANQPDNGGGGAGGVLTTANATAGLGSLGSAIQRGIYGRVGNTSPSPGATGLGGNTSTTRITGVVAPGAGGSGGASNPSGAAGAGGAGDRGGGGGGGGASANGNNGGAGGAGGSGFVIVTALF